MQRSGLKQARLWTLRKVRDWNFTGIKRYLSPIIRCRWKNTAQKQESPLEEAEFNVWETFDFGQVNEHGYEEGNPDGSTGRGLCKLHVSKPEERILCDVISTDENGTASHSDIRSYHYSKTYCMGHPAPEWVECDHEGEGKETRQRNAAVRRKMKDCAASGWQNRSFAAEPVTFMWEMRTKITIARAQKAMEAMLEDRDETYENFIRLEYGYTAEEKKARNGYTIHGTHRDDP